MKCRNAREYNYKVLKISKLRQVAKQNKFIKIGARASCPHRASSVTRKGAFTPQMNST